MKALDHISFPEIAERICALYSEDQDSLLLGMLGREYLVRHDGVIIRGQSAPEGHAAVILDYLSARGEAPVMLPWRAIGDIAGRVLPDFRKRVEVPLATFASDIIARATTLFPMIDSKAAPSIIGSDLAFTVRALPKVYLHVEVSGETQDFPPEVWLLFSNNAGDFLTVPSLQTLAEIFKDRLLSLLRIY